jgi:hypothetical protein
LEFPAIHTCLICEYARIDPPAPIVIVGLYGAAPHVRIDSVAGGLLTFVLLSEPFFEIGEYDLVFRLSDESSKQIASGPLRFNVGEKGGVAQLVLGFMGLTLAEGSYTIGLLLGDRTHYQTTFKVKKK